ncbi:RNA polymerase sigma factor [Parapedobacter sp.]
MGKQWTDAIIWKRFQLGDKDAFTKLVNQNSDLLYGYGRRFSSDEELVRDCIQDVFLTLWRRRAHLSETTCIRFYLMKALRQRIVRESTKWKSTLPLDTIPQDKDNFSIDLENDVNLPVSAKSLLKAYVDKLTPRQREIIYLRFYENLKQEKIAELMGLNRQSVYNLQRSALVALKKLINHKPIRDCLIALCLSIFTPL